MSLNKAGFNEQPNEIFEWIKLKDEIGSPQEITVETATEKFKRKFGENPFVPLGALATVGCLSYGLYSFRTGNKVMSQYMMRARVVAQGFTLAALVGGIYLTTNKADEKDK